MYGVYNLSNDMAGTEQKDYKVCVCVYGSCKSSGNRDGSLKIL